MADMLPAMPDHAYHYEEEAGKMLSARQPVLVPKKVNPTRKIALKSASLPAKETAHGNSQPGPPGDWGTGIPCEE